MSGFVPLVLATLIWLGLHLGVSGTRLRGALVAEVGEARFRAAFSLASIGALVFQIITYRAAPTVPLWFAPDALRWILVFLMLPAFVLFVASPPCSACRRSPPSWRRAIRRRGAGSRRLHR